MAWKCALCAFAALHLVILINHCISRHAGIDLHSIKCNLNSCTNEYTKLGSFASHVHRRHSMFLQCGGPSETGGEPTMITLDVESSKHLSIDKFLVATNRNLPHSPDITEKLLRNFCTESFYLFLEIVRRSKNYFGKVPSLGIPFLYLCSTTKLPFYESFCNFAETEVKYSSQKMNYRLQISEMTGIKIYPLRLPYTFRSAIFFEISIFRLKQ